MRICTNTNWNNILITTYANAHMANRHGYYALCENITYHLKSIYTRPTPLPPIQCTSTSCSITPLMSSKRPGCPVYLVVQSTRRAERPRHEQGEASRHRISGNQEALRVEPRPRVSHSHSPCVTLIVSYPHFALSGNLVHAALAYSWRASWRERRFFICTRGFLTED